MIFENFEIALVLLGWFQNFWKSWAKFVSKLTPQFDAFWPEHPNVLKICTLTGSFSTRHIMFEIKMYRKVMFHKTEEWCKIWGKTNLQFGKWHEEFGKFLPEQSKVSKLRLWWDPFIQRRKCTSLKSTEEYHVSCQWRMMQNLKRKWLVVSKLIPQFDEFRIIQKLLSFWVFLLCYVIAYVFAP